MTTAPRKPVLGLVGGIGAGKSTVADALVRHGGRVVAGDPTGPAPVRRLQGWGEPQSSHPAPSSDPRTREMSGRKHGICVRPSFRLRTP